MAAAGATHLVPASHDIDVVEHGLAAQTDKHGRSMLLLWVTQRVVGLAPAAHVLVGRPIKVRAAC
jgi:hypothetical protein